MAEFFDIDGDIPVSVGLLRSDVPASLLPSGPIVASSAWDTDPPRAFDPGSAVRNGVAMSADKFWPFVARVRASAKAAS